MYGVNLFGGAYYGEGPIQVTGTSSLAITGSGGVEVGGQSVITLPAEAISSGGRRRHPSRLTQPLPALWPVPEFRPIQARGRLVLPPLVLQGQAHVEPVPIVARALAEGSVRMHLEVRVIVSVLPIDGIAAMELAGLEGWGRGRTFATRRVTRAVTEEDDLLALLGER